MALRAPRLRRCYRCRCCHDCPSFGEDGWQTAPPSFQRWEEEEEEEKEKEEKKCTHERGQLFEAAAQLCEEKKKRPQVAEQAVVVEGVLG